MLHAHPFRMTCCSALLWALVATAALAQAQDAPADADDSGIDKIGQQAAALEAELGKYKDTSPQAADTLVKLVDLYHANARAFGLIRAGQKFTTSHPNDPRHAAVMIKLIDGLESMSRSRDLTVACRQFLLKYPKATEKADILRRLARTLDKLKEPVDAAKAYRALWELSPNAAGQLDGMESVVRFLAASKREDVAAGAELAQQMLDKLPPSDLVAELGMRAFQQRVRLSQWSEANLLGNKLAGKNLPKDDVARRDLLRQIAENYARQQQYANAVEALKKTRAMRDDQEAHYQQITRMYNAAMKAGALKPVVDQYIKAYPQRDDRFYCLGLLAYTYHRDGDDKTARQLFSQVMMHQAAIHSAAANFVSYSGTEPADLAAVEKQLQSAIHAKTQTQRYYAQYALGFTFYRDRMKDPAKARAVLRDMLIANPPNDGNAWNALSYVLDTATDDNEFRADADRLLEARRKHAHLATFRNYFANWVKQKNASLGRVKRNDPKFAEKTAIKSRVAYLQQKLKEQTNDPLVAAWTKLQSASGVANQGKARKALLAPDIFKQLTSEQQITVLSGQAYYMRHYASTKQRPQSVAIYQRLVQQQPDWKNVTDYVRAATDYGPPELMKDAAEQFLKLKPERNDGDIWRRLLIAAEKNQDPSLAKQSLAYAMASQKQHGDVPDYSAAIGDQLMKLELEQEALDYWKRVIQIAPGHHDAAQAVSRLLGRIDANTNAKNEDATDEEKEANVAAGREQKIKFVSELARTINNNHGAYTFWLVNWHIEKNDAQMAVRLLQAAKKRQDARPLMPWNPDVYAISTALSNCRNSETIADPDKQAFYQATAALDFDWPSAQAKLLLLATDAQASPMERLLRFQRPTTQVHYDATRWDQLMPLAQAAFTRGEYGETAALVTGMLEHLTGAGATRQQAGRDMVARCYARIGSVGLTIDETSPTAPLLQAALYLRLGDEKMAYDTYAANDKLFDKHRNELPSDLVMFVCNQLIAAGGQANFDRVEEIVRGWIIKNSESAQVETSLKAQFQLLLAKNYFSSQRYDVARTEFTTVLNRYPELPEATEAEFGIGETFMAQKVFDQAEQVFEKLANSQEIDIVVRAEFLRGVLAFRRGDHDDARDIFRNVLERSPNIDLANQTLFNLSEVFGAEERYLDQLNLLRTVGRLGRSSKRQHRPGMPLSIVVHDTDLGISRGHSRIEVIVTTVPGGDTERVFLTSGGASKGLFRVDLDTQLGESNSGDGVLQLTGNDTVRCDYPEEFKKEFQRVPLSDVEIRIAADAKFEIASSKIIDVEKESFAERLERETREREEADQRMSQGRPSDQVKPGNLVYLRVQDPDRDVSGDIDEVTIKLAADSGDQVQVALQETGSHTGVFEGQVATGELPAGALSTDMAIDHSPLMAIDQDPKSYWMSEPDGAAPKSLSIDMKDLKEVSRVTLQTPKFDGDESQRANSPVRGELLGSQDGEFWFRIAGHPAMPDAAPVAESYGRMQQRIYPGNHTRITTWDQVANLGMNGQPVETADAEELRWGKEAEDDEASSPYAAIWHGLIQQDRASAVRFEVRGQLTALAVDGRVELTPASGTQRVDVWLEKGRHEIAIFSATRSASTTLEALWVRADFTNAQVSVRPFVAADFELREQEEDAEEKAPVASIELLAADAEAKGKTETFGVRPEFDPPYVWNWKDTEDQVAWKVNVATAGIYEVWVDQAHPTGGSAYRFQLGDQSIETVVESTGGWANKFRKVRIGGVAVQQPGSFTVSIQAKSIEGDGLMDLKGVELRPAEATVAVSDKQWQFQFRPLELRYVRFKVNEYFGEAVAINHVEVANGSNLHIPTKNDVLTLAQNDTLEIAGGDEVTANYTDEFTQAPQGASRLLSATLTATYFNAEVDSIAYDFVRNGGGAVDTIPKRLLRIDPGDRIIVQVTDYDEDRTAKRDSIQLEVVVNDGDPIVLEAVETEEYSGVFTKEVDTSAEPAEGKLVVKPGDRVYCRYLDTQNTFPGHSVPRETVVYVNEPTEGLVRILESRVTPPTENRAATVRYSTADEESQVSGVAFEAPLTVEVIDPDAAKDSRSTVDVLLKTSDGATITVECELSTAYSSSAPRGRNNARSNANFALEQGRFIGQVVLQLGGKDSPTVVPLTAEMPRGLVGGPKLDEEQDVIDNLTVHVLNVTGKDTIAAGYHDQSRPDGVDKVLASRGRLIVNGQLACTDQDYNKPIEQLHVGEKLYLRVTDADQDSSDGRDTVELEITTKSGEKEAVILHETLGHSGVFTGSLTLKASAQPTPGNLAPDAPVLETYFGDTLQVKYVDQAASTDSGTLETQSELPVVIGTNGLVSAFTKVFNDEDLAIETKFHIAESYFELFKSHRDLQREDEEQADLEAGRRILNEVMEDYPDPRYAPRVAYLLGQFAQELGNWKEAIQSYDLIIRRHPDHSLAPDAQYKLAQCYEEAGDFDEALEGYVTLAATYPKNPLIANVMIRISDYFYKDENYEVASQVGTKFLEKFEGHQHAPKMAFRVGQCYYKAEKYKEAGEAFDQFAKLFPDDKLAADALFWAGESYRQGRQNSFAFRRYNRCRWDFPASEAAKYARGRLALPEMLQQFEAEAANLDQ